jgi:TonB family protein
MPPTYPEAERHACRAGKVVLDSIIDRTGKISAFHVQQSMNPQFDLAALEAVRLWRFTPARLDGKPVAVYYTLTVNFQIDHPCTPRG